VGVVRRRVVATGRVQGVFFRDTCRREAQRHSVAGWVTNRADGAVEAVFEGEEAAVRELVEWARRGPRHAHVDDLQVSEEDPTGGTTFTIR
jgi:acylphosphatase